jgi:hypothetical protein
VKLLFCALTSALIWQVAAFALAVPGFSVGDMLTIIGWPGRGRERTMLLRTAVLKDGTRLSP